MDTISAILKATADMRSDKLQNYIIPGLRSSLLNNGKVRLFEGSRHPHNVVTPHNHRFALTCVVLSGEVVNTTWETSNEENGDLFQVSKLTYSGQVGEHSLSELGQEYFEPVITLHEQEEAYHIDVSTFHSIQFSREAKVLIFEGPQLTDSSCIIEPIVNGEVIRTYKTLDYMFQPEPT